MSVTVLTVQSPCQSLLGFLEAQVAQIPQLSEMIDVERQRSNTPQADVLRLRAEHLQISQSLDWSVEEVAQLQARCNEFWRHLEPTVFAR